MIIKIQSVITNVFIIGLITACGGGNSQSPAQENVIEIPEPTPDPTPDTDTDTDTDPEPIPINAVNVTDNFTLQAENFVNSGGDGDIQTGSGDIVNFFNAGDYIEFVINIDQPGEYKASYRAATPETGATAGLFVTNAQKDGLYSAGTTAINTGDWNTFQDFEAPTSFNIWHAGVNTIRIVGAGTSAWQFNTDYIAFERLGDVDTSVDSDNDGIVDLDDECANTSANTSVNINGCSPSQLDGDNDGISDADDKCTDTATNVITDITGCVYSDTLLDVNQANPSFPSFVTFNDTTPSDKRWQKLDNMSDEFNEGFDSSKWAKSFWNYGVPNNNQANNTDVTDGNLWIKATLAPDHETTDRWFHTARVMSVDKVKFPMYTESRIKAAYISAYNTFWLNNGDSENRDEIDIIENNARPTYTGTSSNGQFHYDDYPWHMASQYFIVKNSQIERRSGDTDNRTDLSNNTLKGVAWNEDYHVFGALWIDENNVQFYLDGEAVGSVKTTQNFTLEQHLLWDLWTEDTPWVGGLPEKNQLLDNKINTMYVDWVRTWQLVDKNTVN